MSAYCRRFGAKGCLVFNHEPVRDYREFLEIDNAPSHLHWLVQHNNGVFLPPWGKSEQWTLSAQHDLADAERFVTNVRAVRPARGGGALTTVSGRRRSNPRLCQPQLVGL